MLSSRICNTFRTLSSRCYSSPLGNENKLNITKNFVSPNIDVVAKLKELPKLQKHNEARNFSLDPGRIKSLWELLEHLSETKIQLTRRKNELIDKIRDLKKSKNDPKTAREIEKSEIVVKLVKEDLEFLMQGFEEVEGKVRNIALLLPNCVHEDTPTVEDKVIHEFGKIPEVTNAISHLDIGGKQDLIDFRGPSCYFLKNEAALYEISCAYYFADELKKIEFIPFSNPDCARSVVVEGCGQSSSNADSLFTLEEKMERGKNYNLHLVGGASLYSFCVFHTKQTVFSPILPLKYFTVGRQYSPSPLDSNRGLYDTWQRTADEIFILTSDDYNEMMSAFKLTLETLISVYEKLNYHFRVVYLNARSLELWESLRASFQMYSCHEGRYIEVGRISISDSFICERLEIGFQKSKTDSKKRYMKMISGTAVDVTKMLACALEQRDYTSETFSMPECLKSHWYG